MKRNCQKKLSAADIERINNDYLEELQSVTERGLRITIDHSALGLLPEQGAVLANALPRAWTKVYTQKYQVDINTNLDNSYILPDDNPLIKTSDVISARNTLRRMREGLILINSDPRLKVLAGEKGYTSSDLLSGLERFTELYFNAIYAGLFSSPDMTAASFLSETKLKISELDRDIEEINRTIDDLNGFKSKAMSSKGNAGYTDTVQLGDNSLKQVIDLAEQASLSEYLKQVLTERHLLAQKKSELVTEIERSKLSVAPNSDVVFMQSATEEFSDLKKKYIALISVSRQVMRQNYGDFFRPLSSPEVVGAYCQSAQPLLLLLLL